MDDRSVPVLIHERLGALYPHGADELIGSIDVGPAIRPVRMYGNQDVEILLFVGVDEGATLATRIQRCAAKIDEALITLPLIKEFAIEQAPAEWREYYSRQQERPLFERLFLDGFETDAHDMLRVIFDFGDLDQLIVELKSNGHGQRVYLRP